MNRQVCRAPKTIESMSELDEKTQDLAVPETIAW